VNSVEFPPANQDPLNATVALYHFDDKSLFPQTVPDSAHGYNLTVPAGGGFPDLFTNNSWMKMPVEVPGPSTPTSKAARFGDRGDQIQSSVTIPDSVVRPKNQNGQWNTSGFTVEFRMYTKRLPYNGTALYLFRFAQGAVGNSSSEWSMYYNTGLGAFPQVFGPSGQVVLNSSTWGAKMAPNTWHAVKITVDTAGLTSVYVDDMTTPAASHATPPGYSGLDWQLSLGNFVGCMDELRISSTVR